MQFFITISSQKRKFRLSVLQVFTDANKEQYKVSGKNGFVIFESNRPKLRRLGLKHRKPIWQMIEGEMYNVHAQEAIIDAIMQHLEPIQTRNN